MTRLVRRTATFLSAITLLVTVAGCSSDPAPESDPATQSAAQPPPAAPVAGSCYEMSFDEAVAPTGDSQPVDCSAAHTTETVYVGTLDPVVDGHLLAIDSEHVQRQVARACPAQLLDYLGGNLRNLRLSMVRPAWFTPTVEESDAGAMWFRCDGVLLASSAELAHLDGTLRGALSGTGLADRFAMCGTAAPDAKDFKRVPCSADHSWRAIDVVGFKSKKYPGKDVVRNAGQARCEDAGAAIAEDPLTFKWGYEWPTKDQWRAGQKFGRCWAPAP